MPKKARQRRIKVPTIYMEDARPRCEYEGEAGGRGGGAACVLADELHDHVLDLVLDIWGLVPHRHLGDTREVDEGQVQH